MKKLLLLFLLLIPVDMYAQALANFANIYVGTTLPTVCRTPSVFVGSLSGNVYTCQLGVFVLVGIGGGGVITPSQLPSFLTGTAGTDFNIQTNVSDVTFNIPDSACTVRGVVNGEAQIFCGNKTFQGNTVNQGSLYVTDYFSTDHPIEITGETCGTSEANVGLIGFNTSTGLPCWSYDGSTAVNFGTFPRFKASGTALVSGDFAVHANWGNGPATIGTITGTDQAFDYTITATGAAQGLNPTVILTYKDGTWTNAPLFVCNMNGGTGALSFVTTSSSATALTMTYIGTPVTTLTYRVTCVGMGR